MKRNSNNSGSRERRSNSHSSRSPSQSRSRGAKVSREWLANFFSEMLAVERGGVQLYEKALEELAQEDFRSRLEQFHEQTQRHVEICEELLEAAGVDQDRMSPAAKAAEHKANGLMTAEVPAELADLNNIENLVLAETKDHWDWETLGSLMEKIDDADLKKAVSRAVREVRKQEGDHLSWGQKFLTQLAMEAAQRPPEMEEEEMEEEESRD